ncbi:calaxin-like isoform X2 [Amphiura filiformis]
MRKDKERKQNQSEYCWQDTHFCKEEFDSLNNMFQLLTKNNMHARAHKLDRTQFRDVLHSIFHMTDDIIMDRVLRAFDKDSDSYVNQSEWVFGMSVFLKGTLEERMEFCFQVYDLNTDGFISREEMFHLLKNCLIKQPSEEDPEEGTKELIELTLKKMDLDHDSRLSFMDFSTSVKEEPLLLETFGPCLPPPASIASFLEYCAKAPDYQDYESQFVMSSPMSPSSSQ